MWRATIRGLLAHKLRLGLTALAIVLGVGMVSGTYILTDTMNHAFDQLFSEVTKGVAVDVSGVQKFKANGPNGQSGPAERVPESLLGRIQQVPGVRVAEGSVSGYAQLVDKEGKAISTHGGAPTFGVTWAKDTELSPLVLQEGRRPTGPGETGVDAGTAKDHDLHVGDTVEVLLEGPPIHARIVGIFRFGTSDNLLGATLVAFDPHTAQQVFNAKGKFDDILVAADAGVSPDALRDRIQAILPSGFEAKTGAQTAATSSKDIKDQLKFFNIALLVFAGVALFVGAFIIYNTFSILVAQRNRELAMLRALGATPAQVRRSVMAEALIVGLVASAAGLGFGFVIAIGIRGLFGLFGAKLPTTGAVILTRTIVVSLVVGVVTTLVSSVIPAVRAARVPPVAAMRETEPATYRGSRRRTVIGLLVTAFGVAVLMQGLFGGGGASSVGLGALLVFLGVSVLGPLLVRPVTRVLGAPLPRLSGVAGRLGRENATRNPKRTASTAAALMIGLALVGFVSVFASSVKASTNRILAENLRADFIVSTDQFTGFSQDVASQLRSSGAFGVVSEFRQGLFGLGGRNGGTTSVQGVDPATLPEVANVRMMSGSLSALSGGEVLVAKNTADSHDWHVGDTIVMTFSRTGRQRVSIGGIYDTNQLLGNFVISLDMYDRNFVEHLDQVVLATTAQGVGAAQAHRAATAVTKVLPNVQVQDQAEFRKSQADQINRLLALITVLLGFAIFIAIFGIINTLALSILERTRELGLLRAVGMARRQVRTMVRWEAVIIAVFGALLGTVIGVFFGWAMVTALNDQGIVALSIPAGQLAIYIVVAGLFGVFAALFPAWRAGRLDVLEAIANE